MNTPNRRLPNLLKLKRVALGLTQVELAKRIGVDGPAVSNWETGQCWPGPDVIPKLAELFSMKEEQFARELESARRQRQAIPA